MYQISLKFLFSSLGLLISLHATAQWDAGASGDLGAGYGQIALSQAILMNTTNSKVSVKKSNPPFNYYHIKSQELYNYKKGYAAIVASKHKGSSETAIIDKLTDIDYAFNNKIRKYGLNEFHIADRLTTYVAWCWELYHRKKPSSVQITKLNNKIKANMATAKSQKMLKDLSDQQKANWLLNFSFNVGIAAQYLENAKTDPAIVSANNSSLAAACKEIGIDIKNASLF